MPACLIGHITVKDPEKWAEYRSRVGATLAPFGGEVIFRGKRVQILSGEHRHDDAVVIRFPDAASIDKWHRSPEYQALIPTRSAGADLVLIAYEG